MTNAIKALLQMTSESLQPVPSLCIPIVCKYFIFVLSMEMREKNQRHVALRYLR
jgi:hypothetical protein